MSMSKPADNPADPFKKALAEATKVIADDRDLAVSYSVDPPGVSGDQVRLPQVTRRMTREEVLLARGTADAYALRHKYHSPATYSRYAPAGQMARELYDAMETARCEAVGARTMPGTAGNIDATIAAEALRKGYGQITAATDAPLAVAAGYLIRNLATGRDLPAGADNVLELWRDFMEAQAGETLGGLEGALTDQAAFARFARKMIEDLGYGDQLGEDPDEEGDGEEAEGEESPEDTPESQGDENDQSDDTEAAPDQSRNSRTMPPKPRSRWTISPTRRWARRPKCPRARRRWSRRHPRRSPTRTRITRSIPPVSMRKSAPKTSPNLPSSSVCAPISTNSSSR